MTVTARAKGAAFLSLAGILAVASSGCAQGTKTETGARHTSADSVEVRTFVQTFYDWYLPASMIHAPYGYLAKSTGYLDSSLVNALRADSIAQDDRNREALNWDPIVNSQDPCPRYQVAKVSAVGAGYRVTLRAVCEPPNHGYDAHNPTVEVVRTGDRWMITNVWYPDIAPPQDNIKAILCRYALKDDRPEKRPSHC